MLRRYIIITLVIFVFSSCKWLYYQEQTEIRNRFQKIPGVEVINAWGHDDLTLEEISVRIRIKGRGEMVLGHLSHDVYNYPKSVILQEIEGYSFSVVSCTRNGEIGITSLLDIGKKSLIKQFAAETYDTPESVVRNYDRIVKILESLATFPKYEYVPEIRDFEYFFTKRKLKGSDRDPIFMLNDIDKTIHNARSSFAWKNPKCSKPI